MMWNSLEELDEGVKVKPKAQVVSPSGRSDWNLAADVYRKDGNIIVKVNLPGIEPEKIDLSVGDDSIKISGTVEDEEMIEAKDYFLKEVRKGMFERNIKMPVKIDISKAEADYKKGILRITVPEKEASRINKIKVKSEGL